ncbi:ADC synthase [Haematococcus lacustris]
MAAASGIGKLIPAHPRQSSFQTCIKGPQQASRLGTAGSPTDLDLFLRAATCGANLVPLVQRLFSDQLTPVMAYRCLVREGEQAAPSFLLESVVNGDQQGRYSFVGAMPALEVVATQNQVVVLDHERGSRQVSTEADPMQVPEALSRNWRPALLEGVPAVFTGGWVGYAGYDTVRYVYSGKLPFDTAPVDDRNLPDMHLSLYNEVVVFDQATKIVYAISWVHLQEADIASEVSLRAAYHAGATRLRHLAGLLTSPPPAMSSGQVGLSLGQRPASPGKSNVTKEEFLAAVQETKEHIAAGDIFQLVLSQRFERRTFAEPFEVYRALRVVNPSPYMVYMQARGCIIVSSSPEILCRVDGRRTVTNRPLAGTRRRGATQEEDLALEKELLADGKECAEHVMLVDLGRNDVGKVAVNGSVVVEKLMEVERYSHVMHISSTVTGTLLPHLDAWDALRAALPAGTVSGAPKVRAMQIIDELELHRRGPYGGGIGHVSFTGSMDMALGLRTMVVPTAGNDTMYMYRRGEASATEHTRREWVMHLQAGAGLVADSQPESEYEETVNKAAALGRAIDLAEAAFVTRSDPSQQ